MYGCTYICMYSMYVRMYLRTYVRMLVWSYCRLTFSLCGVHSFNACSGTGSCNYSMSCVVFCTVCSCTLLLILSVGVSASLVFQQAHCVCSEAVYCSATAERQLLLASQGVVVVCPSYLYIHTYMGFTHYSYITHILTVPRCRIVRMCVHMHTDYVV